MPAAGASFDPPTHEDVLAAYKRIKPYVSRTPVHTSETFDKLAGGLELFFKCVRPAARGLLSGSCFAYAVSPLTRSSFLIGYPLFRALPRRLRCAWSLYATGAKDARQSTLRPKWCRYMVLPSSRLRYLKASFLSLSPHIIVRTNHSAAINSRSSVICRDGTRT